MRLTDCDIKIKKLRPDAIIPTRANNLAAGYDISIPEEVLLIDAEPTKIPLGFATEIPEDFYLEEHSRSSTFLNKSIDIRVGIIDPDYRGEWALVACYRRKSPADPSWVFLPAGSRVGQVILRHRLSCKFVETDELSDTARATGGFGSTGSSSLATT